MNAIPMLVSLTNRLFRRRLCCSGLVTILVVAFKLCESVNFTRLWEQLSLVTTSCPERCAGLYLGIGGAGAECCPAEEPTLCLGSPDRMLASRSPYFMNRRNDNLRMFGWYFVASVDNDLLAPGREASQLRL